MRRNRKDFMAYDIKAPKWNGGKRVFGIANFRIGNTIDITCSYKDKDGNQIYPDLYRMSGSKARSYPTQILKAGITLYLIPIEDFEVIKK